MQNRNLIWVLIILVGALVVLWASRGIAPRRQATTHPVVAPIANAYEVIRERYYYQDDLRDRRIAREAIRGMVRGLDPFSSYVDPDTLPGFSSHLAGRDHGIGLVIRRHAGSVQIVGPKPDSPAHRAGIYGGQALLAVDGKQTAEMSMPDIQTLLAGTPDTQVTLTLQQPPAEPVTVTLTRREYATETVTGLFRDRLGRWQYHLPDEPDVGYVRIAEFVTGSDRALQEVLRGLGTLKALVLDLRENPGGSLPEAVAVADLFLRDGPIVTVSSRGKSDQQYTAHSQGTYDPLLVVLIDGNTASAAEIVAGALACHRRAAVVGRRTRGKGCVQTMLRLPDQMGQINLTTSEFLIGSDQSITRLPGRKQWGIDPHVDVRIPRDAMGDLRVLQQRVRVMPRPTSTTAPATDAARDGRVLARRIIIIDRQLARAGQLARDPETIEAVLKAAAPQDPAASQPATTPADNE